MGEGKGQRKGNRWRERRKKKTGIGEQQRRRWHPTPVLLPGKSHGCRRLVGCSLWGREELDTTVGHD